MVPRRNNKEIENLNRMITSNKIESVNNNLPPNKNTRPPTSLNFIKHLELSNPFSNSLKKKKTEEEGTLSKWFYKASIALDIKMRQERPWRSSG